MRGMAKTLRLLILVLAAMCGLASAQQPSVQSPLLDRLAGDWVMSGVIHGEATTHDVRAEWVLHHQYLRVREISREKNGKGEAAYEAEFYIGWSASEKKYVIFWLDVWGGGGTSNVAFSDKFDDKLDFLFHYGPEDFHTRFLVDGADWRLEMDDAKDGKPLPFARMKLTRAERK